MKLSITLTTAFALLAVSSHAQVETPNLRAYVEAQVAAKANQVSCDASEEVTGYAVLVGCEKAKFFTRMRADGPCNGGYSEAYALLDYNKAEDCANFCMADETTLSTLLGFNFDCDMCECLFGSGPIRRVAPDNSGTMCYTVTSEISGTTPLEPGEKKCLSIVNK